jgi:hypothetical protein
MKFILRLCVFSILIPSVGLSQDDFLSRLLENEEDADESALTELEDHPLDLRNVSRDELLRLPFLTQSQIDGFLSARKRSQGWQGEDEALAALEVAGDTLAFCRKIFHLSQQEKTSLQFSSRIRIVHPSTSDKSWQGSAYRNYQTLRAEYGAFTAGALAERDPGEKRFDDLSLFFIKAQKQFGATNVEFIAGDFFMEWGQGLALWGPYGQSIGAAAIAPVRRQGRGLRPYLSADENFAFRGAALSATRGPLAVTLFWSRANLDASLLDSTSISLSSTGGLHRTESELAKRNLAEEKAASLSITLSKKRWRAGVLFFNQKYDRSIQPSPHPSNFFDFAGRENRLISIHGELSLAHVLCSGEWAMSENSAQAYQATFEAEARPLMLAGAIWKYDEDFYSSRGRGFGSFANSPQNENGQYLGVRLAPAPRWNLEAYLQIRNSPWRTFSLPLPGATRDFGVIMEWKKAGWHLRARWRDRNKEESIAAKENGGRDLIVMQTRRTFLFEARQQVNSSVQFLTRLDVHSYKLTAFEQQADQLLKPRTGFALSEEIGWQPSARLRLFARLSIFESPESEGIYVYERDLPGLITNFSLREKGERGYIFVVVQAARRLQFSAKASNVWRLTDGDDVTNNRVAWGAQLDWRFD